MNKSISKMKLADLRKLAKSKGVEAWDTIDTRKELIAAIDGFEGVGAIPKTKVPDSVSVSISDSVPSPISGPGIDESHTPAGSKAEAMKKALAKQPKVKILIPRGDKEPVGVTFSVCLNGFRLNIQKGVYVDVPEQVSDIVMKHFNQTAIADQGLVRMDGKPMRVDGTESALE